MDAEKFKAVLTPTSVGEVIWAENFNLEDIVTPVNPDELESLLIESNHPKLKREKLVKGFREGFLLHFEGDKNVRRLVPNLKLRVGSQIELWNKVMKEVQAGRYAGPYELKDLPFDYFIQSPIGLVLKDQGTKTRLIFHLSYPKGGDSVNSGIPKDKCSVKYSDFDEAVYRCIQEGQGCMIAKSDMSMAFRNVPMSKQAWKFLVLKAEHPVTKKMYFFVDKCLPFGSSISCAHFQDFSDAVAHIVEYKTQKKTINYLDDFFFAALLALWCNWQVNCFLEVCKRIRFPVSLEKTFWSTTKLVFLGLMIDTIQQLVCIPREKVLRARLLIEEFLCKKKTTVHKIQKLCGFLNFLCRCIVPGRAFIRRIYARTAGCNLKPHHHVNITKEMKMDLKVWNIFLARQEVFVGHSWSSLCSLPKMFYCTLMLLVITLKVEWVLGVLMTG